MTRTFDPNDVIKLFRRLLKRRGDHPFPDAIKADIRSALENEATCADMMHQLLLLADFGTRTIYDGVRMVDGLLLYSDGASFVVWGTEEFLCDDDFELRPGLFLIGGKPCWIERSHKLRKERVNWAGREGTLYPEHSIERLQECNGLPYYAVNDLDTVNDFGFVVCDNAECLRFKRVDGLVIADGLPAYVARIAYGREAFMWEHEICAGFAVSDPLVVDSMPCVSVRLSDESSTRQLWRGPELVLEADDVSGPSSVGGKLAYARYDKGANTTEVVIGDQSRSVAGGIIDWYAKSQVDNAAVVYTIRHGDTVRLFVNLVELCAGQPQPNAVRLLEDGHTLRVRLEGESKPWTFDLKALGALL